MKKYLDFILEGKKKVSLDDWWDAISRDAYLEVEDLIKKGIDVNAKDDTNESALALLCCVNRNWNRDQILKLLLSQSNIDINVEYTLLGYDDNFIGGMLIFGGDPSFLKDYELQRKISNNKREDILLLFVKYDILDPQIKKENPELFKAKEWGLLNV